MLQRRGPAKKSTGFISLRKLAHFKRELTFTISSPVIKLPLKKSDYDPSKVRTNIFSNDLILFVYTYYASCFCSVKLWQQRAWWCNIHHTYVTHPQVTGRTPADGNGALLWFAAQVIKCVHNYTLFKNRYTNHVDEAVNKKDVTSTQGLPLGPYVYISKRIGQ